MTNDFEPVGVWFNFKTRVILGRVSLCNVVHVYEGVVGDLADQVGIQVACVVATALRTLLAVVGEGGFAAAIGS